MRGISLVLTDCVCCSASHDFWEGHPLLQQPAHRTLLYLINWVTSLKKKHKCNIAFVALYWPDVPAVSKCCMWSQQQPFHKQLMLHKCYNFIITLVCLMPNEQHSTIFTTSMMKSLVMFCIPQNVSLCRTALQHFPKQMKQMGTSFKT